jgi:hypothetical protein
MKQRFWLAGLIVGALVALSGEAGAQVQTGSILVRAVDEQAAVMPGVTVTISSPIMVAGTMTGVTDAGGAYRFPSLSPGTYSVRIELSGFQVITREGIAVSVGQTTPLEFTLRVAGLAESVTVTGQSPVVDTTRVNVGVNLSQKLLETTPSGRDIWSIVEYKVPGLVMASPDVGGNQGGLQRGISSRGTGNAQNTQMINGVNVGDPAAIGFAGYYYDPSSFSDIQVSSGAQDITVPSGGVFINMVTKSGSNEPSGMTLFTIQNDDTQSLNVSPELQGQGLRPNANAVDRITNFNFNLGGPLVRNRLFYFGALNDQRTHVNVVGFPAVPTPGLQKEPTDITSVLGKGTFQLNSAHRFSGEGSRQLYNKPNRGASNTNTPESTFHERDILAVYQGTWNYVISNQMFMDTRLSYNSIDFPLQLKTDQQTLLDQTTNIRTRAAANEANMIRERLQFSSNFNWYVPELFGGRHEVRFGIDNAYTPDSVETIINDDIRLTYRTQPSGNTPAGPQQVQLFNTPIFAKRAVQATALYLQDSYAIKRLTLTGGVRWERVEGWLPEQSSAPSRWFPEGTQIPVTIQGVPTIYTVNRTFQEVRNIPNWKNAGPRFSATYDVKGDGKTALRFSAARYYDQIGTGTPGGLNPNGTIQRNHTWLDNGDLIFQANELGPQTGNVTVPATLEFLRSQRDENLRRPYRNEYTVGVDRELLPNFGLAVTWIQRKEQDPTTNVEIGIPFDYYDPVQRADPGRDGVSGTSDDGTITVYNMRLPVLTSVTQQRNDDRVAQRYKGLEFTATKRYSQGWTLLAGYTWSRTEVDATSVTNPNNLLVNAVGRASIDRTHNFKLTGSYLLPWDIQLGGNFRAQSGEPITRTLDITGLNQNPNGNVTVNAEPRGSYLLPWVTTIDLRVGKIFRFRGQEFEADMDLYNLTNEATVFSVRTNTGTIDVRQGGDGAIVRIPQFLSPTNLLGPRIIRFNLTYKFGRM